MSDGDDMSGKHLRPLWISEFYGPTLQDVGRRCFVLRLAACNLSCAWCDAAHAWDWRRFDKNATTERIEIRDCARLINERAEAYRCRYLLVTGGEPMLQQERIVQLIVRLNERLRWRVEIETAGTIPPMSSISHLVDRFVVSPKLSNSGMPLDLRFVPETLRRFRALGAAFVFVVTGPRDLDEVDQIAAAVEIPHDRVWLAPEGVTREAVAAGLRAIAHQAIVREYNVSPRLRVAVWNNERGH